VRDIKFNMDKGSKKLSPVSTWRRLIIMANFAYISNDVITMLYPDGQEQPRKKEVDKASTFQDPCVVLPEDPLSIQVVEFDEG
jgi:hypothetical protein